ncbi:MAG: methylated-DNA--[protein]-cysteine S-methyltransferase [Candidatus Eisenbacteria bacterium]|nr:methylated-DNA--[protein]-cysteine S-methyltransferase [Candidatus Eisenbacteria bacterium]
MKITYECIDSPIGDLFLAESAKDPIAVWFRKETTLLEFVNSLGWSYPDAEFVAGSCKEVHSRLDKYFAGKRQVYPFPERLSGTDFQLSVWREIAKIPYGETVTYGEIAENLKRPGGSRAVGAATGKNPVSILIPCHRVMGTKGKLTGFGGGLQNKVWLLRHEECHIPKEPSAKGARTQPSLFEFRHK